jgi:acyl-CoA synthetase (AMP-forming)/AMP-acid ligase II
VTVLQATPATWKLLLAAGWEGKADLKALCGGEALPEELARGLLDRVGELWNMYGPTETTIWSTVQRMEADEPVLIGRPIANTTVHVLDGRMEPVPIGVAGELWIGGAGLAKGYVNRPELTAERFVERPPQEGGRLYRTGDLVRMRAGGRLQHLGRLDHQVKVRGFRIELGEIETRLQAHEGVRDAVVVARDERLIAYVVPSGGSPDVGEFRRWLGQTLPDYMIPSLFVPLDSFPLTANGKIDRQALPEPGLALGAEVDDTPPTTQTEERLAEIWREVLELERCGVHADFFRLGGHSLLVPMLLWEVAERMDVSLPIRAFYDSPTIAELALRVDAQRLLSGDVDPAAGPVESFEF